MVVIVKTAPLSKTTPEKLPLLLTLAVPNKNKDAAGAE